MNTQIIAIGALVGIAISVVLIYFNLKTVKKAYEMPRREALRYLLVRFFIRIAALIVVLGVLIWFLGSQFGVALLVGLGLAYLVFLTIGIEKRGLVARLLNGRKSS